MARPQKKVTIPGKATKTKSKTPVAKSTAKAAPKKYWSRRPLAEQRKAPKTAGGKAVVAKQNAQKAKAKTRRKVISIPELTPTVSMDLLNQMVATLLTVSQIQSRISAFESNLLQMGQSLQGIANQANTANRGIMGEITGLNHRIDEMAVNLNRTARPAGGLSAVRDDRGGMVMGQGIALGDLAAKQKAVEEELNRKAGVKSNSPELKSGSDFTNPTETESH